MFRLDKGALRLFRLFGIEVFLHWSWAAIAVVQLMFRKNAYSNFAWNVAEYLTLFAIVLMHEFGHALACRSVGGKAERIVLWPLGGVAYVAPPPRPGAVLWSIAAGPLVNLALSLPLLGFWVVANFGASADVHLFAFALLVMNGVLFVFNMLPFYPLDGGQILQALLWFFVGRARALKAVSVIGMAAAAVTFAVAALFGSFWFMALAGFGGMRAWVGFTQARKLGELAAAPLRADATCPHCGAHPPTGAFWSCACGQAFDAFAGTPCPRCGRSFDRASCTNCSKLSPLDGWLRKSA